MKFIILNKKKGPTTLQDVLYYTAKNAWYFLIKLKVIFEH